jgi:hypothetical protein
VPFADTQQAVLAAVLSAVISGAVVSTLIGAFLHRRLARISQEIATEGQRQFELFHSTREWKVRSVSELLGPVYMQLDRTSRAFARWQARNIYLETKVIREGNLAIRDLLLTKGHLIPPELLEDAGRLVEHYDRWLEEFERQREGPEPDLQAAFTFVGPSGFPFPVESERRFRETFARAWAELYLPEGSADGLRPPHGPGRAPPEGQEVATTRS